MIKNWRCLSLSLNLLKISVNIRKVVNWFFFSIFGRKASENCRRGLKNFQLTTLETATLNILLKLSFQLITLYSLPWQWENFGSVYFFMYLIYIISTFIQIFVPIYASKKLTNTCDATKKILRVSTMSKRCYEMEQNVSWCE